MRSLIKNKKGQLESVFWFFGIVFLLFLLAPIFLKLPTAVLSQLAPIAGNQSAQAGVSVNYINDKVITLWDEMIILLFMGNCLLLFVSAFLVDVHPVFIILYIGGLIVLFVFAMPIWDAVNQMYANANLSDQVALMPLSQFFVDNFPIVLLGIVIISGVIMYAKFKLFNGGGSYG